MMLLCSWPPLQALLLLLLLLQLIILPSCTVARTAAFTSSRSDRLTTPTTRPPFRVCCPHQGQRQNIIFSSWNVDSAVRRLPASVGVKAVSLDGQDFLDPVAIDVNEYNHEDFELDNEEGADEIEDSNYIMKKNKIIQEANDVTEDDNTLLLRFLNYCRDTPVGNMKSDDAELLRRVLHNFPSALADNGDNAKETIMDSLLNRLLDEWSITSERLIGMNEQAKNMEAEPKKSRDNLVDKEAAFRPLSLDFESAIEAWHQSENPEKITRVLDILSVQRRIALNGGLDGHALPQSRPTLKTIEQILEAIANSRERGLEKRATMLVDSLTAYHDMESNAKITGWLIRIIATSRAPGAADRAERLLREAVAKFPPGSDDGLNDIDVFNKVVTAWAKSRSADGPQRAQRLIVLMDKIGSPNCAPNRRTFTSLIDAYAQTNELSGIQKAESILNNVLDLYLEGKEDLEPNVATWTIVISAYARLCKNSRENRRNVKDAARRAGKLLERMERLHEDGRLSCGPDAITYNTVLNAYAFSKQESSIEEAEHLLEEMNERYLDGNDDMKPSIRSIKILVDSWIKQGVMDKAENLWENYEHILEGPDMTKDDLKSFCHSFLHGYCKRTDPRRARVYLDLMLDEGIEPDVDCYDRLIDAYVKKGDKDLVSKSQEVFKIVEDRRQNGTMKPSERIYTSFIRALSKGKVPESYKKVESILQRMQNLCESGYDDVKPSIFTYNACLNACAESIYIESTNTSEAFQTCIRIFSELKRQVNPDHVTFGNLLRCANLLPSSSEKRDKFVAATFKLCCEKGLVNHLILRDLRGLASDELWTSLTNLPSDIDVQEHTNLSDHLPRQWTTNIQPRRGDISRPKSRQRTFASRNR